MRRTPPTKRQATPSALLCSVLCSVLSSVALLFFAACGGGDASYEGASGGEGTSSGTAQDAEGPLIVFLGDSIAAGLHLDAADAFPAVLHERLRDEGLPFRLVNAGVSGDTTAGGRRRLDWILKQDPDWVVVELGGNDGLRGIGVSSIEENLRAILEGIQDSGAKVILLGVKLPPNYGLRYTSDFEEIYHDLADEYDVIFVPFFLEGVGGVPRLNLADGLHPSAEGHRVIAEHLLPTFREVLEAEHGVD